MSSNNDNDNDKKPKGYATMYLGCGKKRKEIQLVMRAPDVDYWSEYDFNRLTVNTSDITGVRVGPRVVLEVYSDPYFYRLRKVIKNPSYNKDKMWDIGCLIDHGIWAGIVRSFKVWNYDYYESLYGLRYCDFHDQCRSSEYCLCSGGQEDGEWCPGSKKRCMPKSAYLHSKSKQVNIDDMVNMNCLDKKMADYKRKYANKIVTFRNLKHMVNQCSNSDVVDPYRQDLVV